MIEQTFDTPAPIRIDVRVPGGDVVVDAVATERTTVELDGPDEVLERATVELRGDELRVHVRDRKGLFLTFGREDVRLRLRCPEGSALAVQSKSADVESRGRLAAVRAETASGDVSIDRCENVNVRSASGDVTVGEAAAEASVQTASGDVRIGRAGGNLSAQVVSGDLQVGDAAGSVGASSVSGDVRLDGVAAGAVKVESVSGDVVVGVRRGSLLHVDAASLSGDTHSELDLGDAPTAQADGPLVELRIKTVSGDISVVRAPAPTPTPQEV